MKRRLFDLFTILLGEKELVSIAVIVVDATYELRVLLTGDPQFLHTICYPSLIIADLHEHVSALNDHVVPVEVG
mgnify:CR=1 FL=1